MTFWEWLVLKPRDSPQPETPSPKEGLPEVTDNVRDSGQTFVFGRSNAGEQVDEKAAMQIPTVYACVRLLAESIAALPLHLYRVTDDNGNKEKARDHPLYKILYRQPNPEMTAFVFWETLMTHLLLWGNAYAQIVRMARTRYWVCIRCCRKTSKWIAMKAASCTTSTTPIRMKFRESRTRTSTFAGMRSSMCRGWASMG
jgi:phage portal protein BeeE